MVLKANDFKPPMTPRRVAQMREQGLPMTSDTWRENLVLFEQRWPELLLQQSEHFISIVDEAHALINYLLRPDVAAKSTNYLGYANGVTPDPSLINKAVLDDKTVYPDAATMKHSLRQIAFSSQRAAHMVNQLLAMARAEDAGLEARRRPVDLAAVTRAVVRDFVPRAMERRIDLGYEGPEPGRGGTRLMAEPVLLSERVRNRVDNALRYPPPGGTVTARSLAGSRFSLRISSLRRSRPESDCSTSTESRARRCGASKGPP
jgi:signal transduction histidine kinase